MMATNLSQGYIGNKIHFEQPPKIYIPAYDKFPEEEIMYDEFEELCRDRLKLLRSIEDYHSFISDHGYELNDYLQLIKDNRLYEGERIIDYRSDGIKGRNKSMGQYDQIRRDQISHFLLRLAFCRTQEDRRWFVEQETRLYRIRIKATIAVFKNDDLSVDIIHEYLSLIYGGDESMQKVSEAEIAEFKKDPNVGYYFESESERFFKIHFTKALRELSHRKRFLRGGYIYLSVEEAIYTFLNQFKAQLENALDTCHRYFGEVIERFENIRQLILNLPKMQTGNTYVDNVKTSKKKIRLVDIDALSERSFPLCMSELHLHLRREHHLKYDGRTQYGLFLKGIGVSLDDSIDFFKREFTKKMPEGKFIKDYTYNIRYNYGKEGRVGEQHGCPFKHYTDAKLEAILRTRMRVDNDQIKEILDRKRENKPSVACKRLFQALHPNAKVLDNIGNHPNAYFDASREYINPSKPERMTDKKNVENGSKA